MLWYTLYDIICYEIILFHQNCYTYILLLLQKFWRKNSAHTLWCVVTGWSCAPGLCGSSLAPPVKVISLILSPATKVCVKITGKSSCRLQNIHKYLDSYYIECTFHIPVRWNHKASLRISNIGSTYKEWLWLIIPVL